jgi:hypothetical protein
MTQQIHGRVPVRVRASYRFASWTEIRIHKSRLSFRAQNPLLDRSLSIHTSCSTYRISLASYFHLTAFTGRLQDGEAPPPGLDDPSAFRDVWSGYIIAPRDMEFFEVYSRNIPRAGDRAA